MTQEEFSDWIGRQEVAADMISPRLLGQFRAALAPHLADAEVPLGLHWCLAPPMAEAAALGLDGHPVRGGFLPPVALPRRMWAAGEVAFLDPLRPGDLVERRSTIEEIHWKKGRSGALCFVDVGHVLSTGRGPALRETHSIVYLPALIAPEAPGAPLSPPPVFDAVWQVPVDPVLLFRFSALTFNGHRIHYDHPYATKVEHYPGLVIHGPLQATLMLNLAAATAGQMPARFSFRGLSPAFGTQTLTIGLVRSGTGAQLSVLSQDGVQCMRGQAYWT